MNGNSSDQGTTTRWRQWRQWREARPARRVAPMEDFVGPPSRPVWPFWVDPDHAPRRRREPQRSDPPRRPRVSTGCGWFESSHDLRDGLEVREEIWLDLPGLDEAEQSIRFL